MSVQSRYPYILYCPDYRESSLGVQVLHRLCHLLNESGQEAWLTYCKVNPDWNTPILRPEHLQGLRENNTPFIAIYPEVFGGNPLDAPVSVRYMLNREGLINKNSLDDKPDDLFFWYRPEFADKTANPLFLNIDTYDLDLFKDDGGPRDRDILYLNRVPRKAVDFGQLPDDVTLLTMENPLSLAELAGVLKRARVFYCYESSGTCALAILCGCPVVIMTAKGYEKLAINEATLKDSGSAGFSWHNTPEAIEHARQNVGGFRDSLLMRRAENARALTMFSQITQQKAADVAGQLYKNSLAGWLEERACETRFPVLRAHTDQPRLTVVLIAGQGEDAALQATLASLVPQIEQLPGSQLIVVGAAYPQPVASSAVSYLAPQNWMETLPPQLAGADWIHCTQPGVHYPADSLRLVLNKLNAADGLSAGYADEFIREENEKLSPCFKPQFDPSLFFGSPDRYCKRLFFRREALESIKGFDSRYPNAFEFAALVKLLASKGADAIGHIDEMVAILAEPLPSVNVVEEECQILQGYLDQQGYAFGAVEVTPNKPYRLNYAHQITPKVSIILPAGSDAAILQRCIMQLLENVNWPEFELLVVNPRQDNPAMQAWLEGLAGIDPLKIRVLLTSLPDDITSLLQHGISHATGEFLLLLDAHTAFVHNTWLEGLLNQAIRAGVGFVGPKIIGFDQHILSAGYITGFSGLLGTHGLGEHWESAGYMQRLQSDQSLSVLSLNCLMIRRSAWDSVGGFDAQLKEPLLANIALCLKFKQAGYAGIWTPASIVASDNPRLMAGQAPGLSAQAEMLYQRWLPQLSCDAAYHPRLALTGQLFTVDPVLMESWQPLADPALPVIVGINVQQTSQYAPRVFSTLKLLAEEGMATFTALNRAPALTELYRLKPDVIVVTADMRADLLQQLSIYKQHAGCAVYCVAEGAAQDDNGKLLMRSATLDAWLVYSDGQAQWLKKRQRNVLTLPLLSGDAWTLPEQQPGDQSRLRVLCQTDALGLREKQFIAPVIAQTAQQVDWVILGPCSREWLPFVKETHRSVTVEQRPVKLHSLQLSLAVIPRLPDEENRFCDDLLMTELAAVGVPALCSDHPSLKNSLPAWRISNSAAAWGRVLDERALVNQTLQQLQSAVAETKPQQALLNASILPPLLMALMTKSTLKSSKGDKR